VKRVTIWKMLDSKTGLYEHNHISDGHVDENTAAPQAVDDYQASRWKGQLWEWTLGYLDSSGHLHELE
jgi:hypothetical protein